jgi:putative flippase GtrA
MFDRTFLKFLLVGVITTIVGSAMMFTLYNAAHLSYWFSSACNYFFTSILSFFMNKYVTFNVRDWSAYMVVSFVVNIGASYFIAYGISKPAMHYFLRNSPQNIRENLALFTGMCLFTGINYTGQRLIVFRKNKK